MHTNTKQRLIAVGIVALTAHVVGCIIMAGYVTVVLGVLVGDSSPLLVAEMAAEYTWKLLTTGPALVGNMPLYAISHAVALVLVAPPIVWLLPESTKANQQTA